MKITLGKKDVAIVVKENGTPSIYFPKIEDSEFVPDSYIYLAAMATFYDDQKFVKKIIKKWMKLASKVEKQGSKKEND